MFSQSVLHDLWALRVQNLKPRMDFEITADSDTETQGSVFSSQEDTEAEREPDESFKRAVKTSAAPNMVQSLALCYMATQILRLPVLLGDLISWASAGSLLYHRAITEIPRDMRDRLPGMYHALLDPQIHLTPDKMFRAVTSLVLLFDKDYGMSLPALNVPLHLFRLLEELALPLEVYPAVRRIAVFLHFDFLYPTVNKKRIHVVDFPEAQLAACIVIAIKLFYGFDVVPRHPTDEESPAAATIDWNKWKTYTERYDREVKATGPLGYENAMRATEIDLLNLSDSKIDDYLDFYAKTWTVQDPADTDKDVDFRRMMLDSFPVGSRSTPLETAPDFSELKKEKVRSVQASLRPTPVILAEEAKYMERRVVRPGEEYQCHKNVQNLEGYARMFYEAMAKVSGLTVQHIVRAVVFAERRLTKLKPTRKFVRDGKRGRVDTEDLLDDEPDGLTEL